MNPGMYAKAGLADPLAARRAAKASEHHIQMKQRAAGRLVPFFDELGLLGGPTLRRWKQSGFVA